MTLSTNQFGITTQQGQLSPQGSQNVVSGIVYTSEATPLVAGQAVILADVTGRIKQFTAVSVATTKPFGFVIANAKDGSYAAGDAVEIAISGSLMEMTAGAAISAGEEIEYVPSSKKVIASASVNPVCGIAYDKASSNGDLIRVVISANVILAAETQAILDEIGSLAALTTTQKGSVVIAINEVDAHADSALARVATDQAASTANDTAGIVADFNTLLGKLKTAGLMA